LRRQLFLNPNGNIAYDGSVLLWPDTFNNFFYPEKCQAAFDVLLERKAAEATLPRLAGNAIVQGHCHHKAVMKMDDEEKVLARLGLDFEILDSGCCGIAGAFGFEHEHYDVSIKAAERVLMPRVWACPEDTLIIANGFSCREQIRQLSGRHALHLAEVIQSGFRKGIL
jgi:Fe-S oxidoreductase